MYMYIKEERKRGKNIREKRRERGRNIFVLVTI